MVWVRRPSERVKAVRRGWTASITPSLSTPSLSATTEKSTRSPTTTGCRSWITCVRKTRRTVQSHTRWPSSTSTNGPRTATTMPCRRSSEGSSSAGWMTVLFRESSPLATTLSRLEVARSARGSSSTGRSHRFRRAGCWRFRRKGTRCFRGAPRRGFRPTGSSLSVSHRSCERPSLLPRGDLCIRTRSAIRAAKPVPRSLRIESMRYCTMVRPEAVPDRFRHDRWLPPCGAGAGALHSAAEGESS